MFGASDEILGRLESCIDMERRIAEIFETCRTPDEIDTAFAALRAELDESIQARMRQTEEALLATFDTGVVERLRLNRDQAIAQLDRISHLFWRLTHHMLGKQAQFDDTHLSFALAQSPTSDAPAGTYHLLRKGQPSPADGHL